MKPSSSHISLARACGAGTLLLTLAACGGGGGGNSGETAGGTAPPPVTAQSIILAADASQALAGSKPVTLTATLATPASVTWTIVEGPGTLSASTGASVTYAPPAAGVGANTAVVIKASAGETSKTYRLTVFPDPGEPGLSLIAGTLGSTGNLDGAGTAARFADITDMAADNAGNLLVVDAGGLRKVTAAGQVSAIDMPISSPLNPVSVSVAPDNTAYLARRDGENRLQVLKLLPDNSVQPFLTAAQTDQSLRRIVAGAQGVFLIGNAHISTVGANGSAGILIGKEEDGSAPCRDGTGADARLGVINDAVLDAAGNLIILACSSVRKVTPAGVVTTLAGDLAGGGTPRDGVGAAAHFGNYRASVAIDKGGNIRVIDFDQPVPGQGQAEPSLPYRVRKVGAGGVVTTLASGTFQQFRQGWSGFMGPAPYGTATALRQVRYLSNGTAIVARGAELRKLADDGTLSAFAGDEGDITGEVAGTVATARFITPRSASADLAGNLYVLNDVSTSRTTAYKIATSGQVTKILDTDTTPLPADREPNQILAGPDGAVYITWLPRHPYDSYISCGTQIYKLPAGGTPQLLAGALGAVRFDSPRVDGLGAAADLCDANLVGFDADGNLYAADWSNRVAVYRKITPQGNVTTVATLPAGVGATADGYRYEGDPYQALVYRVDAGGTRTAVAGTAGQVGNRIGALPGRLLPQHTFPGSRDRMSVTVIGPRTLAVVSGGAVLKLVLPR